MSCGSIHRHDISTRMLGNRVGRHASNDVNPVNALSFHELITANGLYLFGLVCIFITTSESENRVVL